MMSRWRKKFRETAGRRGGRNILKVMIYIIIALVSFYGDGVFVWMNIGHYTGTYAVVFQIFLILGAFCTSASIMCLLAGKASWFTPGEQLTIAYIFTGIEVLVNLLNIVVALNPDLGIVEYWRIFSPATPFVALVGWVIILSVDKEQRERHADLEMEQERNDSEREYQKMVHEANMDLKFGYLDQTKQRLQAALNSPQAQQIVEQHAQNLTAQVLNEITGLPVMPQQPPAHATHMLPNGDEVSVYGPTQQIAQQHLKKEVQQYQQASTPETLTWYAPGKNGFDVPVQLPVRQPSPNEHTFNMDQLKTGLDQAYEEGFRHAMEKAQQQQPSPNGHKADDAFPKSQQK